jgi:WD40 repeat protein
MVFYHGPPFRYNSTLSNHSKFVYDVAFSPNGQALVSVGADAKVILYDGKTGEITSGVSSDNSHTGSIFAVGWDKSGSKLVTASADQSVKLWDVETSKVVT